MKKITPFIILLLTIATFAAAPHAEEAGDIREAQVIELDNGLTVITKEIHTAPVVFFSVWYRVGARNETSGVTGISHALEHMTFKGTQRWPVPGDTDKMVRRIGGVGNAGTSTDYTIYYETVPSGMEDTVIEIEAERMANAMIRQTDFDSEQKVVIEERKMRNEDSPTGLFWEELDAAAFKVHPYGNPIVGWMKDITELNAGKIRKYYKDYYAPNNAIIVICGDFETGVALEKIKGTFGKVPRGETPPPPMLQVEPPQKVEKRIVYPSEKSNLAHVVYAWHAPTYGHEDSPALEIVDSILSSGRQSRLSETFVESGLASSADATHDTNTDPYLFYVEIEVIPGVAVDDVTAKLDETIAELKENLVSDYELQKAKNRFMAEEVLGSQSISGYGRKLGWFMLTTGDPGFWKKYLVDINAVTAQDVKRVAKKYFTDTNRTVGILIPKKESETPRSALPARNVTPGHRDEYTYMGQVADAATVAGKETTAGDEPLYDAFPPVDFASRVTRKVMPNGLVLLVYENHAFPVVKVSGVVRGGGSYSDPADRAGLAKLTAAAMRRGTTTRTYDEINETLEYVGASVEFAAGNETAVFGGEFLEKDFEMGMELLSDIFSNPSFPEDGVDVERSVAIAEYTAGRKSNRLLAWEKLMEMLYPGHPYSNPTAGTEEGLTASTRGDVADFHKRVYRPEETILAIVGDVTPERAAELVGKFMSGKSSVDGAAFAPPPVTPIKGVSRELALMPEKTQDVFYMGFNSPRPADPDYSAFEIMTDVLAGTDLTSRLYGAIREREGLVYYVYGYDLARTAAASFQISGGVSPENLERAVELALEEIRVMREMPMSERELADAKSFAIGHLPLSIETNARIAGVLTDFEYHGRPFSDVDNYGATIKNVTVDDIMKVARKYLTPDDYVLAIAGPKPVERGENE